MKKYTKCVLLFFAALFVVSASANLLILILSIGYSVITSNQTHFSVSDQSILALDFARNLIWFYILLSFFKTLSYIQIVSRLKRLLVVLLFVDLVRLMFIFNDSSFDFDYNELLASINPDMRDKLIVQLFEFWVKNKQAIYFYLDQLSPATTLGGTVLLLTALCAISRFQKDSLNR